MEIVWLGHSCFRIRGREATVLTDPCPPASGYAIGKPTADIVTISHRHDNHSYLKAVAGWFSGAEALQDTGVQGRAGDAGAVPQGDGGDGAGAAGEAIGDANAVAHRRAGGAAGLPRVSRRGVRALTTFVVRRG